MSGTSTTKLIERYYQSPEPTDFFTSLFRAPEQNFHKSELVEIDIIRDDEDIAVPVLNMTSGRRGADLTKYVNKGFTPAVLKYETTIPASELMKRAPGVDPFTDPNFALAAADAAFRATRKFEQMIRRTVELMCAQVMQTGVITLVDAASTTIYSCDYQPKDTTGTLASGDNIVTTGTAWATDGATGDPIGDLTTLAVNITTNGKLPPTDIAFGADAWSRFIANTTVKKQWDFINANRGTLVQPTDRGGAMYQGTIVIGARSYRLWLYDGMYKSPAGTMTRFLTSDKAVMWADSGRRDLTFGDTPVIEAARDARALSYLPRSLNSSANRIGMNLGAYFLNDGSGLVVTVDSRPDAIPTAIDTFGCIDVVP